MSSLSLSLLLHALILAYNSLPAAASFAFGFANVIAASQSIRKCPVNVNDDRPGVWPSSLFAEAALQASNSSLATTDTSSNPPLPTDCSFDVGQQARRRRQKSHSNRPPRLVLPSASL